MSEEPEREASSEAPPEDEGPPLVPRGNAPRWGVGLAVTTAGLLFALFSVMSRVSPRAGAPLALVGVTIAALGLLTLIGSFDDEGDEPPIAARPLLRGGLALFGGLGATVLALRLAVAGSVGETLAGALITASFVGAIAGVGLLLDALAAREDERPFYRREGAWLMVFATLVLLPTLGRGSLVDPWETHYGEVSREILSRDDWISLFWANEGWFWSKPILDFWMQALGMLAGGVGYEPGAMLRGADPASPACPEWAVRFPFFVAALLATYVLYRALRKPFGARAALLGGVALTTMPQWFFLVHQTMTDLPFVASMAATLGFFLLGAHTDPEAKVRVRTLELGPFRISLSAHQLVLGALLLIALPQIVYLTARNLGFNTDPVFGVRLPPITVHPDRFLYGSAGNCGELPGLKPCAEHGAAYPRFHPALQALIWAQLVGLVLYLEWGERRLRRLFFLAGYIAAALSTMAKGPAGVVLPVIALAGYVFTTRRFRLLLDLEISAGVAAFSATALPWFVAMFIRHGSGFTDRLLFHDMYKRAFDHVHDTNKRDDTSFRYYLWQLGYATFPWVGILPAAFMDALRAPEEPGDEARDRAGTSALLVIWFAGTFALFSYMQTKFHHYIFPAVPPLALLVGIYADKLLRSAEADRHTRAVSGAALASGAGLVLLVARDMAFARDDQPSYARLLNLFSYDYERRWPKNLDFAQPLWGFAIAIAVALLIAAAPRARRLALWAAGGITTAFAVWALGVYFPAVAQHWGQRGLMVAYQREYRVAPGPLVAYQMNWKGENFYNGNRLAIFIESGKPFRDFVAGERKKGRNTFYVVLLSNRLTSLRSELGEPKSFDLLSSEEDNNKFTLARIVFE